MTILYALLALLVAVLVTTIKSLYDLAISLFTPINVPSNDLSSFKKVFAGLPSRGITSPQIIPLYSKGTFSDTCSYSTHQVNTLVLHGYLCYMTKTIPRKLCSGARISMYNIHLINII